MDNWFESMKVKLSNTNISIALGLVAVGVAVAFRLFSEADLWFQMFSAILGVIITIINQCASSADAASLCRT